MISLLADFREIKFQFSIKSMEILGGKLDFVLHSIGMSVNVRKGKHYTDPKYDFTTKGWDVSAVSFHKTMNVLLCFFYSAKKDARVFMYTKKMYHNKQTACLVD